MSSIAQAASDGFHNAKAYDAHRPSYPDNVVSSFLSDLGIAGREGARIVEVGAGTGKFTEVLAAREEAFEVVATEPLESMRGELARKGLKGVDVREGNALALPVEDGWGDVSIVAQAFHWFANTDALREIRRTLKPDSSIGVIWNIEDYNKPASWPASTPWEQKLNDLIFGLKHDGNPRFRDEGWKAVFLEQDVEGAERLFATPLVEKSFRWTVRLTDDAVWLRIKTLSQVALLEGEAKEDFERRLREILGSKEVERDEEGRVPLSGVTFYAVAKRV
ncbi:uncharacterized protein DNG_00453 [Cephalotrichum gorgonifer]|uniref:Methyltransferase type 11 domain-containing protein n=1 Tax=Cephalotrichum gorgonifer TaxID=2041049 RepID=A0AAE8SQS3_9PEZI|nr:uncharacterized protein DNG_00453 [Cephalotrichum gorgonifer]